MLAAGRGSISDLNDAIVNLGETADWGVLMPPSGWIPNYTTAIENSWEQGLDPFGRSGKLWKCVSNIAAPNSADGGWDSAFFNIDQGKTYRFVVFVKRMSADGRTYFGPQTDKALVCNPDGSDNTNPYFGVSGGVLPILDRWYCLIGYVHSSDSTATTSLGGIYDMVTGQRVAGLLDYKWKAGTLKARHRCYYYYCTLADQVQYMWGPRVEVCDGNESSLESIIGGKASDVTLAAMASDGVVTPQEKNAILARWCALYNNGAATAAIATATASMNTGEFRDLALAAETISIWTPTTAGTAAKGLYDAIEALRAYLFTSPGVILASTWASTITITRATWLGLWAGYSAAAATMQAAIAQKRADNARDAANTNTASQLAIIPKINWLKSANMTMADPQTMEKTGGVTSVWDAQVYSTEMFGACSISFKAAALNTHFMIGLDSDPAASASYSSMDFALYATTGGISIFEAGVGVGSFGSYTLNTVFGVSYDGKFVYYLIDGNVIRSVKVATAGTLLAFDSSFYEIGAKALAVTFSPTPAKIRAPYCRGTKTTAALTQYAWADLIPDDFAVDSTARCVKRWIGTGWTTDGVTTDMAVRSMQELLNLAGDATGDAYTFITKIVTNTIFANLVAALKIQFEESVSATERSGSGGALQVGDLYIGMGKDARRPTDPDRLFEFAIKEYLGYNGVTEEWRMHFLTKLMKNTMGGLGLSLLLSGSLMACQNTYSPPGIAIEKATLNSTFAGNVVYSAFDKYGNTILTILDSVNNVYVYERSLDGGKTFTSFVPTGMSNSIIDGSDDYFYAVGPTGNLVRMAAGSGTAFVDAPAQPSIVFDGFDVSQDGKTIVVLYSASPYQGQVSRDGGATYSAIFNAPVTSFFGKICLGRDNTLFFTINSSTIKKSIDLGQTWTDVVMPVTIYRVKYDNGIYVALGEDKLYKSSDGTTWTEITNINLDTANSVTLTALTYAEGVWFLAGKGDRYIYKSTDNCDSFVRIALPALASYFTAGAYYNSTYKRWFICGGDLGYPATSPPWLLYTDWLEAGAGIVSRVEDANGKLHTFADGTKARLGRCATYAAVAFGFRSGAVTVLAADGVESVAVISGTSNCAYRVTFSSDIAMPHEHYVVAGTASAGTNAAAGSNALIVSEYITSSAFHGKTKTYCDIWINDNQVDAGCVPWYATVSFTA